MVGGYWLAFLPTLLVILGAAVMLYRFARQASPEWFLLFGLSALITVALIFMTLRVPSYAQVKAFYGLSAIVPFCCFAVIGWQMLTARSRILQLIFGAAVIFFSINSFASVWIRPSTQQHIYVALRSISQSQWDRATAEATAATKSAASNASAYYLLAAVFDEIGDSHKAIANSERGLELDPANGDCHSQLGISLMKQGELTRAIREAQRTLELQPENARAHNLVFTLAHNLALTSARGPYRPDEAVTIGLEALAVSPFDAELHYRIGLAAGEIGDFTTAVPQFAYALLLEPKHSEIANKLHLAVRFATKAANASAQLKTIASSLPDSPALLNELAWLFATHPNTALRDGPRAVQLSERACVITNRTDPALLATLAAALAETGNLPDAVSTAQEALAQAQSTANTRAINLAENLLSLFRLGKPYHEEPRP